MPSCVPSSAPTVVHTVLQLFALAIVCAHMCLQASYTCLCRSWQPRIRKSTISMLGNLSPRNREQPRNQRDNEHIIINRALGFNEAVIISIAITNIRIMFLLYLYYVLFIISIAITNILIMFLLYLYYVLFIVSIAITNIRIMFLLYLYYVLFNTLHQIKMSSLCSHYKENIIRTGAIYVLIMFLLYFIMSSLSFLYRSKTS